MMCNLWADEDVKAIVAQARVAFNSNQSFGDDVVVRVDRARLRYANANRIRQHIADTDRQRAIDAASEK